MRRLTMDARRREFAALDRLAGEDAGDVRKLSGRHDEWRLRVGGYRVLFNRLEDARVLIVVHVLERGRAYRR
jgi:mRNA-degrading endonuclease RelE of RelBE toxin-antitoxin system